MVNKILQFNFTLLFLLSIKLEQLLVDVIFGLGFRLTEWDCPYNYILLTEYSA